jgi:hypothetical protein
VDRIEDQHRSVGRGGGHRPARDVLGRHDRHWCASHCGWPGLTVCAGDLPVREFTVADLARRLLGAVGAAVTGVDIDELGPGVLAAQIGVAGPAGIRQVTAPPGSALALAVLEPRAGRSELSLFTITHTEDRSRAVKQ